MLDQGNRTFIGSVVFVDIVGYSKRTVSEQIDLKDRFTAMLSAALDEIPQEQRLILDTGDGAALSFLGDPEDALFVSMNMRDMIVRAAQTGAATDEGTDRAEASAPLIGSPGDLPLRIGINLGPVKLVRDINGHPNIVGDGINVAQRIMSFANVGQIVVSRSFYDVVSVISDEYGKLFKYEGSRTDKHVREHEIYVVGESAAAFDKVKAGTVDRAANTSGGYHVNPPGVSTGTYGFNQALAADAPLPFLQDKKKLTVIIGTIGAIVLLLGLAVAFKQPKAPVPSTTVSAATPEKSAAPAAGAITPAGEPAPAPTASGAPSSQAETPANANPATTPVAAVSSSGIDDKSPKTTISTTAGAATAVAAPTPATPSKTETAKPAVMGTLNLNINPWGEVLINGRAIGVSPPLKQHKLPPGKYKVEVRNSTLTPHITTIEVKPKEDVNIKHTFR